MKLGRFLFEPCPVDKVSNIWGAVPRHIKMSKKGIESTYHPQDMGWKGVSSDSLVGSIQQHLEEDNVAEDSLSPQTQASSA